MGARAAWQQQAAAKGRAGGRRTARATHPQERSRALADQSDEGHERGAVVPRPGPGAQRLATARLKELPRLGAAELHQRALRRGRDAALLLRRVASVRRR